MKEEANKVEVGTFGRNNIRATGTKVTDSGGGGGGGGGF